MAGVKDEINKHDREKTHPTAGGLRRESTLYGVAVSGSRSSRKFSANAIDFTKKLRLLFNIESGKRQAWTNPEKKTRY